MRKHKTKLLGQEVDMTEVEIVERKEHVAEHTLEDGSIIRFAMPAMSVMRIDGQWDASGNPVYIVIPGASTTVISAGESTKKPEESHGS